MRGGVPPIPTAPSLRMGAELAAGIADDKARLATQLRKIEEVYLAGDPGGQLAELVGEAHSGIKGYHANIRATARWAADHARKGN
eukprot:10970939-Alexandrium_andersonii.AAC.1